MEKKKNELFSIPNILTMFRMALIIVFVILFFLNYYIAAAIVLGVSGITDILDGYIARKFNMITWIGKALDPFADKLTQIAVLTCLIFVTPYILIPLSVLLIRDAYMLFSGIYIYRKTHETYSAKWYGKVATFYTYCLMGAMLMFKPFFEEQFTFLLILIIIDACLITLSFVMYLIRNAEVIKDIRKKEKNLGS